LRGSSPWLLRSLNTDNKQLRKRLQLAPDILTNLRGDSIFGSRDRQLLIFLTKELYDPKNCSSNNNPQGSRNYFVWKNWLHRNPLKGEPETADNQDQQMNLNPLKIIEKAVNFLRRRFDRFKHKYDFDELSEMIKILKIDKYDFGIENNGSKFIIWKKRKGNRWKVFAELFKNCNIAKTKLKVK
jgi:hypothetical protein